MIEDLSIDKVIDHLLLIFNLKQLAQIIKHAESVAQHGYGKLVVTWRDYKVDLIIHEASEKAEDE